MSDQTPAPERPADDAEPTDGPPHYLTHAPRLGPAGGARPATKDETRTGVRAALLLCVPLIAAFIGGTAWLGRGNDLNGLLGIYGMVGVVGLIGAVVLSAILPRPSRTAFWTTIGICAVAAMILWAVTCAALVSIPAGN